MSSTAMGAILGTSRMREYALDLTSIWLLDDLCMQEAVKTLFNGLRAI